MTDVERYKLRRAERLAEKKTLNVDSVDAYKLRRDCRLRERIDADFKESDHPRSKDGRFTSGSGSSGGAEKPKAKTGGKKTKSASRGSSLGLPKLKSGATFDEGTIKSIKTSAEKSGKEKEYASIMKHLTKKDIAVQKGLNGEKVASVPGLAQKMDNKMVGRSEECQKIYDEKIEKGKKITSDMIDATSSIGCPLYGLEHCFKGGESASGKIDRKREKDREIANFLLSNGKITKDEADKMTSKTDEEYAAGFDDIVRFTVLSKHEDTADTVNKTVKAMQGKGYELKELDNKWLPTKGEDGKMKPSEYKGVHLAFQSPTGETFEVQVHSKESMDVKNVNHGLYEKQRDVNTSDSEKKRLGQIMADNVAKLQEPRGIMDLQSIKKKK